MARESEKPAKPAAPPGTANEPDRSEKLQEQLDEALAESFPASDPVSIVTSQQEDPVPGEDATPEEDASHPQDASRRGAAQQDPHEDR